jgi:hypothetical protein
MADTPNERRESSSAFRAWAADEAHHGASFAVEARLRAEVRRIGARRRRTLVKAGAICAGLCALTAIPVWQLATFDRREQASSKSARVAQVEETVTGFFPLEYSTVEMSGGRLVRMEVSREALAAFGLEEPLSPSSRDSGRILADVLVGDDGLARAVRFVTGGALKEPQK